MRHSAKVFRIRAPVGSRSRTRPAKRGSDLVLEASASAQREGDDDRADGTREDSIRPCAAANSAPATASKPLSTPGPRAWASARCARLFDLVVAIGLLLVFTPLMIVCALVIRFSSHGPVLYRQVRIGRGGTRFDCLKFRTMQVDSSNQLENILSSSQQTRGEWSASHKLSVDPRVTREGRLLRRYSLDELPQLFNVVAGEMSIVGPRPIVAAEIARYGTNFRDYCRVRPGLTGIWQVSGRHALPYQERVRLDAEYARSKSVRGDVWIILRTIPVVIFGQNG